MTEVNQNLGGDDDPFVKGDSKQLTVAVVDEAGVPKNLTGLTNKRYQAWQNGVPKIVKAAGDISIVNAAAVNDGLRFTFTPGDTINLEPGLYEHEMEIIDASAQATTVMKGALKLTDHLIV